MAGRKAKTGQLLLVGALAVGLGYLAGTWALNLLLPRKELPERKQPQITDAQGQEFSDAVVPEERFEQVPSAPVEAEEPQVEAQEEAPAEEPSLWRVVAGFTSGSQLEESNRRLRALGYETMPIPDKLELQLGIFQDRSRARVLADQISAEGYSVRIEEKKQ
jgi:hypothetical protein